MAVFYAFATVAGCLIALGSDLAGARLVAVVALAVFSLMTGLLLWRFGQLLSRRSFHLLVGMSFLIIAFAVTISPDALAALSCAFLVAFGVVEASYFFGTRASTVHLIVGVGLTTGSLVVRGDVHVATALGMDAVVVALALVTRTLVLRASGANIDPLTGLANRRGFDAALQDTLAATRVPASVGLLDLDHFKQVNDTAGHEAGDRLLCQVADLSPRSLPRGALLARHGGDEFALLMPGLSGPDALAAVRRICDLLPGIGLSCGVAQFVPGESATQLMRRADGALYRAKAAGRGRAELDEPAVAGMPR